MKRLHKGYMLVVATLYSAILALSISLPAHAASNITVLNIQNATQVRVVGSSTDGSYIAYTALSATNPNAGDVTLHQYDVATGQDIAVAQVDNGLPIMSGDGQTLAFSAFGQPNSVNPSLQQDNVYTWTADGQGGGTYNLISTDGDSTAGFVGMSSDASLVSYSDTNGTWLDNTLTNSLTQINKFQAGSTVLSPDGSTLAVNTQVTTPGGIFFYSTATGQQTNFVSGTYLLAGFSTNGQYAVGYGGSYPYNIIYYDVNNNLQTVLPNTGDNSMCAGTPTDSYASISGDGQTVAFGSLSSALAPDPSGGNLGYYAYFPSNQDIYNESGTISQTVTDSDCPSTVVTPDASTIFFTSDTPLGSSQINMSPDSSTPPYLVYEGGIQNPHAAKTSVKLTVSPYPIVSGQSQTLTATISSSAGVVNSGKVTFDSKGKVFGTAKVVNGVATLTIAKAKQPSTLMVVYNGTAKYASSWSNFVKP